MAEIYVINVEEDIDIDVFTAFSQIISTKRKRRANKYYREIDRKRCVCAEVIIRYIACKTHGLENEAIQFDHNEYGKPFFINPKNHFFSISHAGKWVVCGWSQNEIGVDVEYMGDNSLEIAKRFFHESEYMAIMNQEPQYQREMFYELWTLKESYIKYKGKGLSIPLNSFQFKINKNKVLLINKNEDENNLNFFHYKIDEKHILSICTVDPSIDSITYIKPSEILSLFLGQNNTKL